MKKSTTFSLHRWIALAFAPLILLQAVTGGILLFREPLAKLFDPSGMSSETIGRAANAADLALAAERATGRSIVRLFMPRSDGGVALARMYGGAVPYIATLDPVTAQVLSQGPIWNFPSEAALDLHYQLLSPPIGAVVVILTGMGMLAIAASGAAFWWPGRGRVLQMLKVRRGLKGINQVRAWHRLVGPVAMAIITFSTVTGLIIAVTILPPLSSPAPMASQPLAVEAARSAVSAAGREFPGAKLRDMRFLQSQGFQVNFHAPERNAFAVHSVFVGNNGKTVTRLSRADQNREPWVVLLPLHAGTFLGSLGLWLLALEAAALVFLTVSGPLAWWRRRQSKRRA